MSKSKKRNRNIKSFLPLQNDLFLNFSNANERPHLKEHLFGEFISSPLYKSEYDNGFMEKNCVDTDAIISEISGIKLIKSISCSPSWSDDTDVDASMKIQIELERMDRVLRGIDPIPLQYDIDEYKQWMETFPDISLFGKEEYGPYQIWNNDDNLANQNFDEKSKVDNTHLEQYRKEIKRSVINNIYDNISLRLKSRTVTPQLNSRYDNSYHRTQTYLNDCLKNSPFDKMIQNRYRKNSFINRQSSVEEPSRNFQSLPLVFEDNNIESELKMKRIDEKTTLNKKKLKKNIVLPPIIDKNRSNQLRSISAYSCLSSIKAGTKI